MNGPLPHVLLVSGSPSAKSSLREVLREVERRLAEANVPTDFLDLAAEPLPAFNPDTTYTAPHYAALKARVERADVLLLGTPDYHGTLSGALKNFLDHFWKEYAGKLMGSVVASYDKGLTVTDHLRTVARQVYAWSLPYAVTYADKADVAEGRIVSDAFRQRVEMLARDVRVYGGVLAAQRRADLAGTDPGFLARLRS